MVRTSSVGRGPPPPPGADYAGAGEVFSSSTGSAVLTLVNSVVMGHETEGSAAFFVHHVGGTADLAVLNLRYSTVTANVNEEAGDGTIVLNNGTLNVSNTILWGNEFEVPSAGADLTVGVGAVANVEYSDLGDVAVIGVGGVLNDLGGNLDVDPELVGVALSAGSPMIDAGSCAGAPAIDFGGDVRPSGGGCDIGADEFVP